MSASVNSRRNGRINPFAASCSTTAIALACAVASPNAAMAQDTADEGGYSDEIIVTAQKR